MDGQQGRRGEADALHEAQQRFRSAFEEAGIGMAIMALDGRFLRVNRELCQIVGHTEQQLLDGPGFSAISDRDELAGRREDFRRLVAGDVARYRRDRRYVHADGRPIWGATTLSLVRDAGGRALYAVGQLEDITARKLAEQRAQRRGDQQAAVARLSQLALVEHDFGVLVRATVTALTETLGASIAALARTDGADADPQLHSGALHPDCPPGAQPLLDPGHTRHTLATLEPVIVRDAAAETRFDARAMIARGLASGLAVPVAGEDDKAPLGVLGLYAAAPGAFDEDDVACLRLVANVLTGAVRRLAAETELRHQALHDPLTRLPNRALLLDRLRHGIARGRREGRWVALLYLDIDDFNTVNESWGHGAGDQLLRDLAPRLGEALRPSDTLARVGGDEFAVICDGLTDPTESVAIAERVLRVLGRSIPVGSAAITPSTSIGIALAGPGTMVEAEDLVRDAAAASCRAKAAGRGRYELFDDQMRADAVERLGLIQDLRRAVDEGHLRLAYQPVVSYAERRVVALEALARWTHAERGEIGPGRFIPLAEQHGLIVPLGSWVLCAALDQLAGWRDADEPVGALSLSVNVSRVQLGRPGLAEEVLAALHARELVARQLIIEVTESAVMDDPAGAASTLAALHARGVRLALDDFGVGQSSLACLRDLPLDVLKLDRGFITGLATSRESSAIVRAVTEMARTLRFPVIAEGIESEAQATVVEALGCEMGQGFLYARPVAPEELPAVVAALDATLQGTGLPAR